MKQSFSFRQWVRVSCQLLLLCLLSAGGYSQSWQLAQGLDHLSSSSSSIQKVIKDGNGNLYVSGLFHGSVSFGSTTIQSVSSAPDAFVAKWNIATRSYVWVQKMSGVNGQNINALACTGNAVYLAGAFSSPSLQIGSSTLLNTNPTTTTSDAFLIKLVDNGTSSTVAWSQQLTGPGTETISALVVQGSSLYLAGSFSDTGLLVQNVRLQNTTGTGSYDMFVGKLIDNGSTATVAWLLGGGGTTNDLAQALAVSGNRLYVSGILGSAGGQFGTVSVNANGDDDAFVASITDTGTNPSFIWVTAAGTRWSESFSALAVSGTSLYVAGTFIAPTFQLGNSLLTNSSSNYTKDVFVAKLTDTGTISWGQQMGGPSNEEVNALAAVGNTVYVAGYLQSGSASFGSLTLYTAGIIGNPDGYVAKLTDAGATGSIAGALGFGSPDTDLVNGLLIDGSTVYVAGSVMPGVNFGSQSITAPMGTSTGFLATLADLTLATVSPSLPGFTLAPNPARAATTVTLPSQPGRSTATLTLVDALGRRVQAETINVPATGLRHELKVTGLVPGLYNLQVQAGSATATRKLVVE